MQYANNGNLSDYLDKNLTSLTWNMKLLLLKDIANHLQSIHENKLIHCDLHGGNIVFHNKKATDHLSEPFICDLGLSQPVNSSKSGSSSVQGVLPYIAPEVFHTHEFTQESDIYAFGILMYQMASGELPFRDRAFNEHLVRNICNGLRPIMPDSAPEPYKKLAESCCDAIPNNRPTTKQLLNLIIDLIEKSEIDKSSDNIWNTIYSNKNIKPLSYIEKKTKYSSKLLPTGNLPRPRNNYNVDSGAGMECWFYDVIL